MPETNQQQEVKKEEQQQASQQKEEVVVELTPLEEQAVAQGWVPKDEWVDSGGDPDEWRTAKEFIDRGELYRSIHTLRKEQKQLGDRYSALKRHQDYIFDKAYQKALKDLRMEKRQALKSEDLERVEEIEEQIETLQDEYVKEAKEQPGQKQTQDGQPQSQEQPQNPVFVSWVGRNPWFSQNKAMRTYAEGYGIAYANNYPGTPAEEILRQVEIAVKRQYPDKFGAKRAAPNAVAGSNRSDRSSTKAKDDIELDDMERDIMRGLVESGEMTEAEYKASLKKVKGL